ncbi:MAG TPA: hypothetical protein VNI53_02955, partial [Gammaproteobacteria bacterium]|nr:hypothetical protein [Gammaproteobacteria bacterium]
MNIKSVWTKLSVWMVLPLMCSAPLLANADTSSNVSTNSDVSITLHGFIDTTAFWQSQDFIFGNGQNAEFPVPNTGNNHNLSGISVQNTRAWLDIKGPALSNGWSVAGHLEGDF